MSLLKPPVPGDLIGSNKKTEALEQQACDLALSVESVRKQTLAQSNARIEALEQKARDLAGFVETTRQQILLKSDSKIEALEQKARDLADFVEALRNQTRLQSEKEIEALGKKAGDLAHFVESVRKETRLQFETEIAAMGQKARDLAVSVEAVREITLLQSDSEIAMLAQSQKKTVVLNEALLLGSLHQHELTEAAENMNAQLLLEVAERKQAEESLRQSEARFRALFDWGPIAMYSCDASGTSREFNRVAIDLWGLEPKQGETDERLDGPFKIFLPDGTFLPYPETPMTKVLQGELPAVHDMEVVIERPDGSRINVIANIVPLKNEKGEITGAINCFFDITERSRLERQTLEQAGALADLHRRKDEFLAMLSHELRNPLAPISNAVHLLRFRKDEDPIQNQARGIIERQLGQLTLLIDDLMEVSRISTGRIHLHEEQLALNGIVKNALETVRPLIAKHRHSLELDLSPQIIWLFADAARLEQVVVNLLTNAAKYTDDDGSIWLSVQQEGDEAVLRVRDSGVGIAPELLPHIFDLFTQAERSLDRSQGGLGIGLCLVKRLVELHRGKVEVTSTLGQGSEFVVRLPVAPAYTAIPSTPSVKAGQTGHALRVLVVDDSVDSAETVAMVLEVSGHEVRKVHDGPAALVAALDYLPQVILLDIGLPGMNGFEVATRLRQQPALGNVVLIAMTGYGEASARKRSKEAGFDHHLVKPADFAKLLEILAGVSDKTV